MRHILLAVIITLVFIFSGYIIFARFEGSRVNIERITVENNQIRQAQGLPVGSYVIFTTRESNSTTTLVMKLWRYQLGSRGSEIFYENQAVASSSHSFISRFSDESLKINFKIATGETINQLVHLNGQVIGPAELGQAIISPNRTWLLLSPDNNQSRVFLKNISNNESFDITPTSTSQNLYKPLQWSDNGDRVFFMNTSGDIYEFIPATMQLNNIVSTPAQNIVSASVLPHNNIIWGISRSPIGDNIFTKYVGEELKSILEFTDKQIRSAVLSPQADSIAFSLDNDNIWLKSIANSQTNKQTWVGFGRVLAWPERNNIIFSNESGLFIYDIFLASSSIIFNPKEFTNLVAWDFLDMLYIR
jgi:hypothetical protein